MSDREDIHMRDCSPDQDTPLPSTEIHCLDQQMPDVNATENNNHADRNGNSSSSNSSRERSWRDESTPASISSIFASRKHLADSSPILDSVTPAPPPMTQKLLKQIRDGRITPPTSRDRAQTLETRPSTAETRPSTAPTSNTWNCSEMSLWEREHSLCPGQLYIKKFKSTTLNGDYHSCWAPWRAVNEKIDQMVAECVYEMSFLDYVIICSTYAAKSEVGKLDAIVFVIEDAFKTKRRATVVRLPYQVCLDMIGKANEYGLIAVLGEDQTVFNARHPMRERMFCNAFATMRSEAKLMSMIKSFLMEDQRENSTMSDDDEIAKKPGDYWLGPHGKFPRSFWYGARLPAYNPLTVPLARPQGSIPADAQRERTSFISAWPTDSSSKTKQRSARGAIRPTDSVPCLSKEGLASKINSSGGPQPFMATGKPVVSLSINSGGSPPSMTTGESAASIIPWSSHEAEKMDYS